MFTHQAYPEPCRNTARALGDVAFKARRWDAAVDGYEQSLQTQEILLRIAFGTTGKLHALGEMRGVPPHAVYACWKTGRPDRAVEALESGRARLLGEAESARLLLADGDLTLDELYGLRLEHPQLTVLSACETAIPGLQNPGEMRALPSDWMQAGVPGVVGRLWSVNDQSTALLLAHFDDLWHEQNMSLPQALCQAQSWLGRRTAEEIKEDLKTNLVGFRQRMASEAASDIFKAFAVHYDPTQNFAHPYHWGGFIFVSL